MTSPARTRPASGQLRVAIGLALGPAVALGLARFAYALLLPSMRSDLDWSYAQAGAMNTANAVGYLAGALVATRLVGHSDPHRLFRAGLALTTLAILAPAVSGDFAVLAGLRLAAGATGAVVFVSGAGLVAQLASDAGRGPLFLGVYIAGAGAGIAASGALVPAILNTAGPEGWRIGWLALAAIAAVAAVVGAIAARRAPSPPSTHEQDRSGSRLRQLAPLGLAYLLFGVGYIAYATFIIAHLRDGGMGVAALSAFWIVLGLSAVAAPFAWDRPLRRLRGGRGPAAVIAVVAVGAALPLVSSDDSAAFLSAFLFGGSFLAVVAAVTEVARRSVPAHEIAGAIGGLTVAFALGQCAGPLLAGVLSDGPQGVRAGLLVSAAILAAGILVCLLQTEAPAGHPATRRTR